MGHVYRETFTKPLPPDAELFTRKGERSARWVDRNGRKRAARVTTNAAGVDRLLIQAATYTAKYRNGAGLVVKAATGCRTLDAAKRVLDELETRADKVRSGGWTAAEDSVLDHQTTPIAAHVARYLDHLRAKHGKGGKLRVSAMHASNVERCLNRIIAGCEFNFLRDMNRSAVERWIKKQTDAADALAARTINAHLVALTAFGNWCVESKRIIANPLARPPKLDEKADRRRQRRALTEDELRRLLCVARRRPLADYGRDIVKRDDGDQPTSKRSRRTWIRAPLTFAAIDAAEKKARETLTERPDFIARLELIGRERALIYKTLVLTGLRKGELASLTVGQMELDGQVAYAVLAAADEKAGRGADIPLRADLADDIRRWLADRLEAVRRDAATKGEPIPAKLPPSALLFAMPEKLSKILNRDLAAAGIPKADDRGHTVDVHAMRHTFGTHLSKGGVAPRTAQAAMRHSTLELTMTTYTDPRLLDVAGALDVLPDLPLDEPTQGRQLATGTNGARTLVPMLVPAPRNQNAGRSIADKTAVTAGSRGTAVSAGNVNGSERQSRHVRMEPRGIEPLTPSLQS